MSTWSLCRHPTHPHTTLQICGFGHATEPTHTDCKQTWQLQQTHTHKHTCGLKTPNSGKQLAFTYLSINEIHQSSMKSTSEIHLPISDQWNPPISDKWNPPVNPPVYRETHLSVKSTYQSNLPVYQWNPPVYQSNLPVYQWNPPISQIHISVKSTCLSVKSTYQSNPPVYQLPVYQSNLPISQIYLSISQIHLSKSACPPFASTAVTRKPPNSTGPAASTNRSPATGTGFFHQSNYQLLHTKKGVQITRPLVLLYRGRSARWHTTNGWRRKHKAWFRTLAQTN